MLSSILIGSLNLSYQLKYFSLTFYGKQQNFSLTKRRKKVDFASLFLPTKQQKKKKKQQQQQQQQKMPYRQ